MKKLGVVATGLVLAGMVGCGGTSHQNSLIDTWIYDSGDSAIGLTFDTDNTYSAQVLVLTSSTTANDQVETGTFTKTTSEITFTPKKFTCPGPDTIYTLSYQINGNGLTLVTADGALFFTRDMSPDTTNARITFGCFLDDGSFVAMPLAPVSN